MKLPRTHQMSFGNRFGGLWKDSNDRNFLFGRDPFDNLWSKHKKHTPRQKKNKECCEENASSAYDEDQVKSEK